ncbi:MAG: acetylxylan esterase, partial [Turicibacter sp.]
MPALDFPLEQLKRYKGSQIKALDFESYWKSQIMYVDNLPLEFELKEVSFSNNKANYYDLTFKSFDGAKIYAKYIRPNHERKVPTVIQFHDYKESSKSWFHLTRFIGIDYGVVAMDCRGQGGKSED